MVWYVLIGSRVRQYAQTVLLMAEEYTKDDKDENITRLRNDLREALSSELVQVVFTKKDGTERTMLVTTYPGLIPESLQVPLTEKRQGPENQIRVFEFNLGEWRSFNFDSIISVEYDPEVC